MRNNICFLILFSLLFTSCKQEDKFTGLWNKDFNPEFDAVAFPAWKKRGRALVDTVRIKTPMFIRIKKVFLRYEMNCYQFDAARNAIVKDPRIFDFVKFTKEDEYTLMSDNRASNIVTESRVIVQIDPATGNLSMSFSVPDENQPHDKNAKATFRSMFASSYHKLMEVRRKSGDPDLLDDKLKSDHLILGE